MKAIQPAASGAPDHLRKTFEEADSVWFSALSGDLNPLHMDPSYSTLTPFGRPVVHGMAAVLEALGSWTKHIVQDHAALKSIKIQFRKPIFWGVELQLRASRVVDNTFRLEWVRGESLYLSIEYQLSVSAAIAPSTSLHGNFPRQSARPISSAATCETQFNISDFRYSVASDRLNDPRSPFQGQPARVRQIQVLAWASYFIGMEFPGTSALFLDCAIEFTDFSGTNSSAPFRLDSFSSTFDPRFRVWTLKGTSPDAQFTFRCIDRPEPVAYSSELLTGSLPSDSAFRGKTILVTGGSRGFGSVLCDGLHHLGADVWHSSRSRSSYGGLQEKHHMSKRVIADMSDAASCANMGNQLMTSGLELDGLILNASPLIMPIEWLEQRDKETLSFVAETAAMVLHPLRALLPQLKKSGFVIYISSEYVKKPIRHFSHYIAAKSGAEALIRSLSLEFPTYLFIIVRPPKMLTNQTNNAFDPNPPAETEIIAGRLLSELSRLLETNDHTGVVELDLLSPDVQEQIANKKVGHAT
jgi:NAD(P)-dependent dehydrogenase (short-subunit alcohol dehydrogenase family)/acyl dehydratase